MVLFLFSSIRNLQISIFVLLFFYDFFGKDKQMDITINELEQLMPDSYRLLDMRGDVEVGHGMIPGAYAHE